MLVFSYFRFFVSFGGNTSKNNNSDVVHDKKIAYWNSYLRETFDDESNSVVDSSNNNNYYIEINDTSMKLCTYIPDSCDEFGYVKENNKYIIHTTNEKILNANLTIEEDVSERETIIKVIKTYDEEGGYSVFYFKKVEKSVK